MSLVTHPGVDKVAFTGSTEIGKRIAKGVAGTDKALTLELGGKAANIVFDDAPLDQAVEGIVNGIYFNQGEVCCAGSRLLAQESIVEPLIDKLKDRLSTIRVGDPLDKNTDVGAINSKSQLEKITELVASGVAEGAELYQPACDLPERGYFFRPTLFTNVAQSHRIAREEIFGPVLSVLTFRTPDEAVEKANNTVYGLSAGIWTDKGSRILEMVAADAGRRRLGQHVQPVRPDVAVRRLQGIGLRARGRHARPARLRPARGPLMAIARPQGRHARAARARPARSPRAPRAAATAAPRPGRGPQDLQAVHRRRVPADRIGPLVPRLGADGTPLANACRASRKDLRDAVRAARKAFAGWAAKTAMNRGQVLYRVAELMEGRREQFVAEVAAAEGSAPGRRARRRRPGHRSLGLVRRLGRQDRPGPRLVQPGRGAVLQLHDPRADRRRRASSRPRRRRCSGSSAGSRRRSSPATRSSSSPARGGRCRPSR